ncbi:MAG TPA: 4Fe-4S binding protein [Bryobacteraceae bacterium]|nr:4Fe-4S binding protein [Bryobacteraceae bacterium]
MAKKTLVRRVAPDLSQQIRLGVQLGFLGLNVWLAVQFYLWVRFYETGGRSLAASRPDGIEGWLPIAALMNLKYLLVTREVPRVHAAGMFLLMAFLATSLLARKAFCGWLCPIGTISEYLWKLGRETFRKTWTLPRWLDIPLRSLKYILLGLFLYAVLSMSAEAIDAFLQGPYGQVADVKMLNFFRYLSTGAAITIAVLVVASIFVKNFWCRYLCPYGAMMGLVALASPLRIRRTPEKCIDCAKCAKACPSVLPVDQLIQIRSPECLACMECVAVCPAEGALALTPLATKRPVPAWAVAVLVLSLFGGVYTYANYMGYWQTSLPADVYFDLVPKANEFSHP